MRFTPQFLDDLRARLPVSEVVGRRVKLKRAGREWKGLSPFQQEKSPSFTVNDQKGFYHDFSSGKHGDIISFLMETEGVGFTEAVERLAAMAGVSLPAATPEAARHEQRRKTLYDVMELAAKFFADTLASRNGAKARGYLGDRAISPAVQLQFRIGYAPPDRFALKEHLGSHGIPVEDMVEAGLLVSGDDIPVPYDRFRDRVMFPIADLRGRAIAFGGRALEKDVAAKYLNSPETPLFHKGDNLYNLAPARLATHNGAPLVVVEGYVDVIAMVGAGFAASVAPLGTALTENQLALLWKMADEPILCFDGDKAGQKAAWRAADLALPHLKPGKSLRFALLPEGQDPDDLARSGGRAAIEEVISAARGLADVIWSREIEGGSFATPERRAALEARIGELSAGIRDEVVLMASGGIRTASDIAKAIALGADGCILGTSELVALGCTRCSNCERGRGCPFGLTTTDPQLSQLVDPDWGAERISHLYASFQLQLQNILRRLGLRSVQELRGRMDVLSLS